jgi:hypothetical protein
MHTVESRVVKLVNLCFVSIRMVFSKPFERHFRPTVANANNSICCCFRGVHQTKSKIQVADTDSCIVLSVADNWIDFWIRLNICFQYSTSNPWQTFCTDPHGGNFLLLPDGRIGMIDYGATKRLIRNERLSACLLYAALKRKDEKTLFDMCDVGGYKSKYGNRDGLMKLLQFGYDSWGKDVTGGKKIQQFIGELKQEDPWEEVPDDFVLAQVSRLLWLEHRKK